MKLLSRTYNVQADINHVYYCFSNVDYILNEINRLKDSDEIRVHKKDNELIFKGKTDLFSLKEIESDSPKYYRSVITPIAESIMRFGEAIVTCEFSTKGKNTQVQVNVTSRKTPNFFWRVFIKTILFVLKFQSRKAEKKYIKAIEQSA